MGESAYSLYTPPNTPHIAGLARARSARRDKFGRFMPNDVTKALPVPLKHGQQGGRKRASTAKRDSKGRYTK